MRRTPLIPFAALAAATVLGLTGCGTDTMAEDASVPMTSSATMTEEVSTMPTESASAEPMTEATPDDAAMAAGAYLTLAEYRDQMADRAATAVVYFFHAPWCPDCRATDESLTTDGVPAGVTVVKVDFDSETALRQEYGITQQHTFVQVNSAGEELAKWTGSATGAQIKANTV